MGLMDTYDHALMEHRLASAQTRIKEVRLRLQYGGDKARACADLEAVIAILHRQVEVLTEAIFKEGTSG